MSLDPSRQPLLLALAATLACGTISGGPALAGPLDLDALPAATTAVVHVDVEAMMRCEPLRRLAAEALQAWPEQLPIDPQKDVLDATAIDDMQGYRVRLSPTARRRIEDALAKLEPDQVQLNYGKHVVHVFGGEPSTPAPGPATGKKRIPVPQGKDGEVMVFQFGSSGIDFEGSVAAMPCFFSFLDDQTVLVADDVRSLTRLLDAADGKTPSLADKGGDVWKARAKAPQGTWITSIGLGNFLQGGAANAAADGPLTESVASLTEDIKAGWCYVGESKPDQLFAECHMETTKPEAASQAKAVVDGFKALMLFSDDASARFSRDLECETQGDDMLERRLRDEAPRGLLATATVRRRVLEAAVSGAERRQRAARRVAVAATLLVAAVSCVGIQWLPTRSSSDRGGPAPGAVATAPRAPADIQSPLPRLMTGFDLPNGSRKLARAWLAHEVERASGGMLTVAGAAAKPTHQPAPAWNDPRHVVRAISRPDKIPMLLAKLSREAISSRFAGSER